MNDDDQQRPFPDGRAPKPAWATPGKIAAGIVTSGAIVALLLNLMGGLFGGLRPQSQIDLAELQKSNAALKTQIDAVTVAEASDKALVLAQIDTVKQLFATRLDAMWRPSDYADRDAHLSRLDTVFDGLRDKTTDNGYAIKGLQDRYTALTTVPTPGPARAGR